LSNAAPGRRAVLLTELLSPDRVVVPLHVPDRQSAIAALTHMLADRAEARYDEVLASVLERESVQSTGIGFGVAIPHGRCGAVRELAMVAGVSAQPVPFDSIDGEPVRLFFLIVGPESSAGLHVKILSRIARLVRRDTVRQQLLEAATPDAFYNVILDAEAR
jgi:mannitol/fructose-specific phosphotransferase system IIA component (Ntr-type)